MALWETEIERWALADLLVANAQYEREAGRDPAAPIAQLLEAIEAATGQDIDKKIKAQLTENVELGISQIGPPFPVRPATT